MYKFNEFQTPITEGLLNGLNPEVRENLLEAINGIPFIRNLISPDRKRAKDLPRDSSGRIIVDLCNPHILEDMDYFTEARRHFQEHGVYTFLKPNSNPNSAYYKWIIEERRRCLEGMVRPSDGEWITGDMYFHMNYCPMMVNVIREGTNQADRIEDFPAIWEGLYWRYHYIHQARNGGKYNDFKGGNHCAELARRGCGKSYTLASLMSKRLILGESMAVNKRVTTILTAYLSEYLADKDGTLSKFLPMIDHCANHTQFPKRRLIDSMSKMVWQMGYKDSETLANRGSLNTVMGVSVKDQEGKLRGKRGYIFFEEFGSFPNLLSVYNNVRPSVEEGNTVYALLYLVGTSGDQESDFASAQELMYHPKGYNIYALPNVFDKEGSGKHNFSFFFPGYINRSGCYNKDGVSDVVKALIEIYESRLKAKYNTSDTNTIIKVTAEIPVTPQEAILKVKNNIFPISDLTERLSQIDSNPSFYDSVYSGELVMSSGKVEFKPKNVFPIRDFPLKGNNHEGAIEVFNMPEKGEGGNTMRERYIIGVDPYDNDQAESQSLGSVFVLDLFTDNIVAEFTGRPMYADDFFEEVRKLALFYNAKILYENNKKGLYGYFQKMNSLHLLSEAPEYLKDKQILKAQTFGNSAKGIVATASINNYARDLIREWLLKPVETVVEIEGETIVNSVYNLYYIRNRALLKELMLWNTEGNFDRVSALGILMLYRQDYMIKYQGDVQKRVTKKTNKLSEDDFFRNNFKIKKDNNRFILKQFNV